MKLNVVLLFTFVILFCAVFAKECPNNKIVVCYWASWGVYREGFGKIDIPKIKPELCTHLVYTFAGLDVIENKMVSLDPGNDFAANNGKDSYKRFIELKQKNPQLKTLLAVGGWNEKSRKYSVMAASEKSREEFAESVLRFLVQYEFDGIDFDWEYPALRGGIPEDKQNFIKFLEILKNKLKPWDLLLTLAVGVTNEAIEHAYDIREIAKHVDYISLMCYDYTASTSATTGLLAPLKPVNSQDKTPTIDSSVNAWINGGCPAEKLILGIPLYARTFRLKDGKNTGIGAETITNTWAGRATKEIGFLSNYELKETFQKFKYVEYTHASYQNNYATNQTYWITYDTESTVTAKVNYAKSKNLSGVMAWSIDTDDFQGVFSKKDYPLLRAINDAIC